VSAVALLHLCGNGFAQRQHTRHRRVLVVACSHRRRDGFDQRRVAIEVGEPLRQVDGLVLVGELGHHRKDADANVGQLRFDVCDLCHLVHLNGGRVDALSFSCRLAVAGAGCRLPVAGCRLPVAGCRLP
jgi:hypothetical protein